MELVGQKRQKFGKETKSLRLVGLIPASIFGKGFESLPISINIDKFTKMYKESGDTGLIDIKTDKETYKVLVKEVQYDPVSDFPIHVGFYKPDLKVKTTANVPVEVIGEEKNDLVKSGQAVVLALLQEIEVEALPADLPSAFEVDVSGLAEIDAGITVSDLKYDKSKVEIVGVESDALVLKLDYAQSLEEEEEEISEEEALEGLEATAEKPVEEGEEADEEKKDKGDVEKKEEKPGSEKKDSESK